MQHIPLNGIHAFSKVNVVTQLDKKGLSYDTMKCSICGIKGKCYDTRNVKVSRYSKRVEFCAMNDKQIKKFKADQEIATLQYYPKSKVPCPDCGGELHKIADYVEEDSPTPKEIDVVQMKCKCGFDKMLDAREFQKGNIIYTFEKS